MRKPVVDIIAGLDAIWRMERGEPGAEDDLKRAAPTPFGFHLRRTLRDPAPSPDLLRFDLMVAFSEWQEYNEIDRHEQRLEASRKKRRSRFPAWMQSEITAFAKERWHDKLTPNSLVFPALDLLSQIMADDPEKQGKLPSERTVANWISDAVANSRN